MLLIAWHCSSLEKHQDEKIKKNHFRFFVTAILKIIIYQMQKFLFFLVAIAMVQKDKINQEDISKVIPWLLRPIFLFTLSRRGFQEIKQ